MKRSELFALKYEAITKFVKKYPDITHLDVVAQFGISKDTANKYLVRARKEIKNDFIKS